jgi:hypothetical protein
MYFLLILFTLTLNCWSKEIRYKGENKSLIQWRYLDAYDWLDYLKWEENLKKRESMDDFREMKRNASQQEIVGTILKCIGDCLIYQGTQPVNSQFRSRLREGEVLETTKGSHAWVLLVDGTLLRLSSHTTVSFNEINITDTQIFFYFRLNEGHIYWRSRMLDKLKVNSMAETDRIFLPLMIKEANKEFYQIDEFKTKENKELFVVTKEGVTEAHIKAINEYFKNSTPEAELKNTNLFLTMPNGNLKGSNSHFHAAYILGDKAYIFDESKRPANGQALKYMRRGFDEVKWKQLESDKWYELNRKGSDINPIEEKRTLAQFRFIVKRIYSIILGGEIFFKNRFEQLHNKTLTRRIIAESYGYKLWKDRDINKHLEFLIESTQRSETANLVWLHSLLAKKDHKIEVPLKLSNEYSESAINAYFNFLSGMRKTKHPFVHEYTKPEYYYWLLHYGREKRAFSPILR